jgi:hypothetical protein
VGAVKGSLGIPDLTEVLSEASVGALLVREPAPVAAPGFLAVPLRHTNGETYSADGAATQAATQFPSMTIGVYCRGRRHWGRSQLA